MFNALDEIDRFIAAGEELTDADKSDEALVQFRAAWDALPEPKSEQERAVDILAAIADCCFFLGRWEDCRDAIQHAFWCGGEVSNPFLRMRMGQSLYELGDVSEAENWLIPVYLMEGREPFEGEDPKYLESFRSRLNPPAGGWPEGW